jgi:creatinine amidohydrolase
MERNERAWEQQTYADVKSVAEQSGSVLVVPVASIEQHGHHLPVGTDTLLVEAVARGAIDALDGVPAISTPTVWTGFSPLHLSFGGTISIQGDTLRDLLKDVADSALENGFDGILYVNGHGGNKSLMGSCVNDVGVEHSDVEVAGVTYFDLAEPFVEDLRDSEIGGMAHAGEFETSLMLHLFPELVRTDELEGTMLEEPAERGLKDMYAGGPLSIHRPFATYSESGAIGDPEAATAEKGEALFEYLGDELGDIVEQMHTRIGGE